MPVMTNAHALVVGITSYQHINPLPQRANGGKESTIYDSVNAADHGAAGAGP